ncbi:MAG: hypothetical protein CVU11_14460 [Bacteroidetes bacterium HGW-Bacteroidetes-6]|nr:MAG: hypothetical protein CVU11_14460 [Bacteroidetes bacterium HGW-Bacteroidetes-6]
MKLSDDSSKSKGALNAYYDSLFNILYQGFSDTPYARYTVITSFIREYAFSVEKIDDRNFIISNNLSENFWYAKNRNSVTVTSEKTEIADSLYNIIGELFQLQFMEINALDEIGLDDETYYFSTISENNLLMTKEKWSPNENSFDGLLVSLCNKIYKLGKGQDISQAELFNEINDLIIKLKSK